MRVLTGLQPSGKLHLGNYFASIKQMIEAQNSGQNEMFIFIADYHAMTSVQSGIKDLSFEAAAAFLALGIEPEKSIFWKQSDCKTVLELYWILSQLTPMGLLERAHSYKDKLAKGKPAHHGLFSYPVLMAADILLFKAEQIPVGKDQIQHVEIARDIAIKFNNIYGDIFVLPEAKIVENLATVLGTDGAKMSKSYGNTIDIFSDAKTLKKQCGSIITDSTPLEAPKQWQNCNIFNIAKLFLSGDGVESLKARYEKGGEGHGHFKAYLNELVWDYFKEAREKFSYYMAHENEVSEILDSGAKKAQNIAQSTIDRVKEALKF